MMTPERAFETYLAVKMHFEGKYDFFKYNGKIGRAAKAFSSRNDKYKFNKLAKRDDVELFLASNFARKPAQWVGDLVESDEADRVYASSLGYVEAVSYKLKSDLERLPHDDFSTNLMRVDKTHPPPIVAMAKRGEIAIETVALLNNSTGFLSLPAASDPTYESWARRVATYGQFLRVGPSVVTEAVVKIFPNGKRR